MINENTPLEVKILLYVIDNCDNITYFNHYVPDIYLNLSGQIH